MEACPFDGLGVTRRQPQFNWPPYHDALRAREPMFAGLFSRGARQDDDRGEALYAAIVAAARRPGLYRDFGAPDTLPGRFELVVLHSAMVLRRLRREQDPAADAIGQEIFDAMCRTLDANLREIGVGDLSVPKRMKAMVRSFYDGAKAYDAALDGQDRDMFARSINNNIFAGGSEEGSRRLAEHARLMESALAAQPLDRLLEDGPAFPPLPEHRP